MRTSFNTRVPLARLGLGLGLAWLGSLALAPAGWTQATPPPATDEPGAVWAPASDQNFGTANRPTDRAIDMVIIHDIEGPAESAVRWFQNPQAKSSAHYVIDGSGKRVWQQVRERDVAWHAGNLAINNRSVGIEHEGFADRPGFFNQDLYEGSARLVRSITSRYLIPRDRTHIIAHAEVPSPADPTKFGGRNGHTDPGMYWDWDYFMTLVRNDARLETSSVPAVIHPGEKVPISLTFANVGDDAWLPPALARRAGALLTPVYLSVGGQTPGPARTTSALYDTTWTSPRYLSPVKGDAEVAVGGSGAFTCTLRGPRELGTTVEQVRLARVPAAPYVPVPFGPTVPLSLRVEPWEIIAGPGTPAFSAPGWAPGGTGARPTYTRKFERKETESPQPAQWSVPLPIDGQWELFARWPGGRGRAKHTVYQITADGEQRAVPADQRRATDWQSLGRFHFSGGKPVAVVTLAIKPGEKGTVDADAIRLVGPFAR